MKKTKSKEIQEEKKVDVELKEKIKQLRNKRKKIKEIDLLLNAKKETLETFEQLKEIEEESSITNKKILLENFLSDRPFRQVIDYCLKKGKEIKFDDFPVKFKQSTSKGELKSVLMLIDEIFEKNKIGKKDKEKLINLCSSSKELFEITKQIVQKKLKCGVTLELLESLGKK